ncbi:hypothetical protein GOP47_0013088 [Adiantum capillus-veneris]|uniref:Sialyltransferase-like protein 1 n=1 Tax=Adiantum capillus-veneris TaxID=13818 RepID=A0A9D4ZGB2_ADICA|nr:hypothetical protein GOP47_0013088 [Adiantum capillus-veneris]
MRAPKRSLPICLRPVLLASTFVTLLALALFVIQLQLSPRDLRRLALRADYATIRSFHGHLQQCVATNGLGLSAYSINECEIVLKYPEGTNSSWFNQQFKMYEPLEYRFDVCESLLLWEQYRNVTTILTREYLDARPDGWLEYAAQRISQLGSKKCYNMSKCEEELQLVLPAKPPFLPRQFAACAVVGNSGDLLKTEFGQEIDAHDVVIRDNEAPVNAKYAKHVGLKRDFRIVARGVARNMKEVVKGAADEILIIKSLIHRDFNTMIKELPNPVYLFQGVVFRRGAKGTGVKSIELALSMCDQVDIYGFTVDPGYTEWTRYFSTPRKGHNPLQGRAYYQLLECLGVIRIHSPLREERKQNWEVVPSRQTLMRAHEAARKLRREPLDHPDSVGPFSACKVWARAKAERGPLSGSPDMSHVRKNSNYSRWEKMDIKHMRKEAQQHYKALKGTSLYKLDGNKLDDLVCIKPARSRMSEA